MDSLLDKVAIKELKHRYCYRLDKGPVDEFVDLFTDPLQFDSRSWGELITTKADLREWISWRIENYAEADSDRPPGLAFNTHLVTNPILDVTGDTATGKWCLFVLIKFEDGYTELGVGRYEDEYHKVDGEWKIYASKPMREYTMTF